MPNVTLFLSDPAWVALCDAASTAQKRSPKSHTGKGIGKYIDELAYRSFRDVRAARDAPWWNFGRRFGRTVRLEAMTVSLLAAHFSALGLCYGYEKCGRRCYCTAKSDVQLTSFVLEALGCGTLEPSLARRGVAAALT